MSHRKRKERGPLTPKRTGPSPEMIGAQLHMLATSIEACGTVQRALDLGMVGGTIGPALLAIVPKSRGGTLTGPDVEKDWQDLVASIAAEEGVTVEERRRRIKEMTAGEVGQ